MSYMHIGENGIEFKESPFDTYTLKRLAELGIDITKDDYVNNPKFREFKHSFVTERWAAVPEDWWIEKRFVSQERLEKIYGPYAMCCQRKLRQGECDIWKLCKNLLEHLPVELSSELDERKLYKRFERDDGYGIPARLYRYLGIDLEKMGSPTERFRLLYLIAYVEIKYNVYVTELLQKPSLENVDNSFIGRETHNGEIVSELKHEIEKAIKPEYVATVKMLLANIPSNWEHIIMEVRVLGDYGKEVLDLDDIPSVFETLLEFQKKNLKWDRPLMDPTDGLLEGVYLLLSAHEIFGRELDLINVAENIFDVPLTEPDINQRYIEISKIPVKKSDLMNYAQEHRAEYAALSFHTRRASSNEYRKYDAAIKHLPDFFTMLDENTKMVEVSSVSALLIISFVQVYCGLTAKDTISNSFFRHTSAHIKSYKSEMKENTRYDRVLDKSQISWVELVIRRYNQLRMRGDYYHLVRQVEQVFDEMMIYVFSQGNLHKVRTTNELLLSAVNMATLPSVTMRKNVQAFEKSLRRKVKAYKVVVNAEDRSTPEWLFFSLPSKELNYDSVAKRFKEAIYAAEREQGIVYYDYDIEVQRGYLGFPIDLYFEILIDPFTKQLFFKNAQVKSREKLKTITGMYI